VLYVYGIVDTQEPGPVSKAGHENAEIFAVVGEGMAAAASAVSGPEILPNPENLWRHERVLEALMTRHTVLPLRFGTIAPSRGLLQQNLRDLRTELTADLDRVRGKVELALRIAAAAPRPAGGPGRQQEPFDTASPAADTRRRAQEHACALPRESGEIRPGTAYLNARLESDRRERAWRMRLEHVERSFRRLLDPLSVESCWQLPDDAAAPLKAAFLVQRSQVAAFVRAARRLRQSCSQLEIACTGPWPPYSFITTRSRLANEC
jgi:hypothetical protein